MPNLVSLTRPRLQLLGKTQKGVFPIFNILIKSLINKNYHKSRTKKFGPVKLTSKLTINFKKIKKKKKNDDNAVLANYDVNVIFPTYG